MRAIFFLLVSLSRLCLGVKLEEVVSGLSFPLAFLDDPLGGTRKFIVEKGGLVKIFDGGVVKATPFIDLSGVVSTDVNEGGLLGMAFHPQYATNGFVFVNYTAKSSNGNLWTIIRRLKVSTTDPDKVDIGNPTNEVLLRLRQPANNHNGGQILFSPKDGYLYIAMGDGGPGEDPYNRAQNLKVLYGKILRIWPSTGAKAGYGIPDGNPFKGNSKGFRQEIWHFGLRNPWRFTFDRQNGFMFIGDVGQKRWEEINWAGANQRPLNFGWRRLEGDQCFNPTSSCRVNAQGKFIKMASPIIVYGHDEGCSVTGGYRYRGKTWLAFELARGRHAVSLTPFKLRQRHIFFA